MQALSVRNRLFGILIIYKDVLSGQNTHHLLTAGFYHLFVSPFTQFFGLQAASEPDCT